MKVYLDVDGVLNPMTANPHKHWSDYVKRSVTTTKGDEYRLWFSRRQCAALREIARRHGAEIVWATSWIEDGDVERLVPHNGLPSGLRMIEDFTVEAASGILITPMKVEGVLADARPGEPIVWIDDEIGQLERERFATHSGPTLAIRPDERVGLTIADLETVDEWLTSVRRRV